MRCAAACFIFLALVSPLSPPSASACWVDDGSCEVWLRPEGRIVPENAGWLSLVGPSGSVGDEIALVRLTDSGREAVDLTASGCGEGILCLSPAALTAGETYELTARLACGVFSVAVFEVGPPAALPETLGDLSVYADDYGWVEVADAGYCSRALPAASKVILLDLAEGAAPWEELLFYETLVDGEPWRPRRDVRQVIPPGYSWEGRGVDRIHIACLPDEDRVEGVDYGLPPGTHRVQMRATLPGTDVVITSNEIEVDLQCPCREDWECGGLICRSGECIRCRTHTDCGRRADRNLFCVDQVCVPNPPPPPSGPPAPPPAPPMAPPPVPDTVAEGCSVARPSDGGGAGVAVLFAVVAAALGARRSRRR
jgi:hypothetical protein